MASQQPGRGAAAEASSVPFSSSSGPGWPSGRPAMARGSLALGTPGSGAEGQEGGKAASSILPGSTSLHLLQGLQV